VEDLENRCKCYDDPSTLKPGTAIPCTKDTATGKPICAICNKYIDLAYLGKLHNTATVFADTLDDVNHLKVILALFKLLDPSIACLKVFNDILWNVIQTKQAREDNKRESKEDYTVDVDEFIKKVYRDKQDSK